MIITFLALLACALVAVYVVRRQRAVREAEAAVLETPVTEREIAENIREDVAPQFRPYAAGQFGADAAGKCYVAGTDGAVRRVAIVETGEGPAILSVKKLGKAERKARKRQIRNARAAAAV